MDHRNRNTALVLIGAGIFLLLGYTIGFFTVASLIVLWAGIHYVRTEERKKGYLLLIVGSLLLLSHHSSLVVAVILIFLGYTYIRSQKIHGDGMYVKEHRFLQSTKRNKEPWELKNTSMWALIAEIELDLSLALTEEGETTIVMQGLIGDIDVLVPEDMGLSLQATVILGQTDVFERRESGMMNKVNWQSPGYETSKHKVKLVLSYMIGDVDIKVI